MTVEVSGPSGATVSVLGEGITEVAVTGAVTLDATAFGKMHLCTGTTADYTVDLPAASGNSGKHIGFRMGVTLTKLVTLDPAAAELIDGQATRVMWAQEVAVLYCDGTGWRKVAGRSRPMNCTMRRGAGAQTLATATTTKIDTDQTDLDTSGFMADTANKKITIRRPGQYNLFGQVYFNNSVVNRAIAIIDKNAATLVSAEESSYDAAAFAVPQVLTPATLATGDVIELYAYHTKGSNLGVQGDPVGASCIISAQEAVSW